MCQLFTQVWNCGFLQLWPGAGVTMQAGHDAAGGAHHGHAAATRLMCQLVTQVWMEGLLRLKVFQMPCSGALCSVSAAQMGGENLLLQVDAGHEADVSAGHTGVELRLLRVTLSLQVLPRGAA